MHDRSAGLARPLRCELAATAGAPGKRSQRLQQKQLKAALTAQEEREHLAAPLLSLAAIARDPASLAQSTYSKRGYSWTTAGTALAHSERTVEGTCVPCPTRAMPPRGWRSGQVAMTCSIGSVARACCCSPEVSDLWHTGNTFSAEDGASLAELMRFSGPSRQCPRGAGFNIPPTRRLLRGPDAADCQDVGCRAACLDDTIDGEPRQDQGVQ
jgi:hypothetical protein